MAFFVVGGAYVDDSFQKPKGVLERLGPFASYDDALAQWERLSWSHVDDALHRYTIVKSDAEGEGHEK